MKKFKIFLISALVSCITFYGCIQDMSPESDYIIEEQIDGNSPEHMAALVNAIPAMMVAYENSDAGVEVVSYGGLQVMLEMMTTDMVVSGYSGFNTTAAYTTAQSINGKLNNRGKYPFFVYYGYIKTVNDIIKMIDKGSKDPVIMGYRGVAHAFRALYYMDLAAIYEYKDNSYLQPNRDLKGLAVPIVTENTTENQAKNNPRATVEKVYELIFSDLAIAESMLKDNKPESKSLPNLSVVYGLYARAYMNRAADNVPGAYASAATYARKAITESGCEPLTQDQWEDPINGFNNMSTQNSWMLATSISPDNNKAATEGSFNYTMLLSSEQSWTVYGWRVGRSLSRKTYDAISDGDFRKHSWLDPTFFLESGNTYSGYQYKVCSSYAHLRKQITKANGFNAWPYTYVSIKFRPGSGNYTTASVGGATDYPIMRVEEMYFIEAEATAHSGLGAARKLLNDFMKYRLMSGYTYDCTAKTPDLESFIKELMLQKRIEFWGEGKNYYDAKRLALGLHRGYVGINSSSYKNTFDLNGIAPQWTLPFPTAEEEGNVAIGKEFDNPDPSSTTRWWAKDDDQLKNNYDKYVKE